MVKRLGRCGRMMSFWKGKKVLITGHTGFKGSWLCLCLQALGANIIGYALKPPTEPNLFNLAKISDYINSVEGDIRDSERLKGTVNKFKPEIVFHLAAQALVRKSYINPIETFETNVIGTVNIFDAIRFGDNTRVVINVTSDKCYENNQWLWGYRETDLLGGYDPYSCSKGCCELITNAFRKSYYKKLGILVSSVRAGNVIGGGDWSDDRLIPDIIKAIINNNKIVIRNPSAVRSWQHVLEALSGYMVLAEKMWNEGDKFQGAWNFGPDEESIITVDNLTQSLMKHLGNKVQYVYDKSIQMHEAQILKLDSSKAKSNLGWKTKLDIDKTIEWTAEWYENFFENENMRQITLNQIERYRNYKEKDDGK